MNINTPDKSVNSTRFSKNLVELIKNKYPLKKKIVMNWFLVKIKYTKQLENGTFKRVSEVYLFASMSFTDAEARVYEELGAWIKGELLILEIKRYEVHDIFAFDDSDVWYIAKIMFDGNMDDEKAKKVVQKMLVSADSVLDAHEKMKESLSGMMVDYTIPSISICPIVEIFPAKSEEDHDLSKLQQKVFRFKKKMEESGTTVEFSVGENSSSKDDTDEN